MDTIEGINRGERMFIEAEHYAWAMAEGRVPELMGPIMNEKIRKGLNGRMLFLESFLLPDAIPPAKLPNLENRTLPDIPAIIALTEKEAAICFHLVGGRTDYAGFFGSDPLFLNWVKDLFLYYWDKGKRT